MSVRVGVVVAVASATMFFITNHDADQQETLLLQSDTTHAAALASSFLSSQVALLDALAANVTATNGSPTGFLAAARQLAPSPVSAALGKAYLAHFVLFASAGSAYRTGQYVPEAVARATHIAETSTRPGLAVIVGQQGFVDLAAGAPMVPDGNIVLVRVNLTQLITPNVTGSSFPNLRMALYGSTHPATTNLLASETGLPLPPMRGRCCTASRHSRRRRSWRRFTIVNRRIPNTCAKAC
jgi:hypothetical protein